MAYYITPDEYDAAEKNGIGERIVSCRVRVLGWSVERAITTPVKKYKNRRRWGATARANGIKYHTYLNRITKQGMSEEEAATTPVTDFSTVVMKAAEAKRRYPVEVIEKAEKNGIKYNTFLSRMRKGWDMEKAATMPPIPLNERNKVRRGKKLS
jgi:hypothetical protein